MGKIKYFFFAFIFYSCHTTKCYIANELKIEECNCQKLNSIEDIKNYISNSGKQIFYFTNKSIQLPTDTIYFKQLADTIFWRNEVNKNEVKINKYKSNYETRYKTENSTLNYIGFYYDYMVRNKRYKTMISYEPEISSELIIYHKEEQSKIRD